MMKRLGAVLIAVFLMLGGLTVPAKADKLKTMEELLEYLYYDCACVMDDRYTFSYGEELDEVFATKDAMNVILKNCGLYTWSNKTDTEKRKVQISKIVYRTGFRIARAWQMEQTATLSDEERETLEIALQMVEDAQRYAQSPYDLLVRLHDSLCEWTVYQLKDENAEGMAAQDNAVGALKYRGAECDGYSDAFYLLGTLAGFQVGYQAGGTDGELKGHIWNVVFWNGKWYHADLTWDDLDLEERPDMVTYKCFMVGGDMLQNHGWLPEYSPHDLAEQNDWSCFYYTADDTCLTHGAYLSTVQDAANYVSHHIRNGYTRAHAMVDGQHEGKVLSDLISAEGSWSIKTTHIGSYTLFDVLIK